MTHPQDFHDLVQLIIGDLRALVPLLVGAALVVFLFGIVRYVTAGQNEEKLKDSRNLIIYGLIALFVMVSVWGLVGILVSSVFGGSLIIPQLR